MVVKVAQNPDFSRVEFHWPAGGRAVTKRSGQTIAVRFSRDTRPDISRLRVSPPPFVKTATARSVGGGLEIVLELTDDADALIGQADGGVFINAFKRRDLAAKGAEAAATSAVPAEAQAEPTEGSARPDPRPTSGVVPVTAAMQSGQLTLTFSWKAPLGAAVFRRGEAVWVVFDHKARLDISKWPKAVLQANRPRVVEGETYTALRLVTPPGTGMNVSGMGPVWAVTLGPASANSSGSIKVARDERGMPASLSATMAGATSVVWLTDPAVGDRIGVVTALAPAKGLSSRRDYVEAALLQSAQGLAVEPFVDDLEIAASGDLVRIGRPKGLALSPTTSKSRQVVAQPGAPQPAAMPALVDFEAWSKTGSGGFIGRYKALMEAASAEATRKADAPVTARMALARFLIGSELSFEGIGVLNALARNHQTSMGDPEFRGLRGAAKVMAGRYKDASVDLASPVLSGDPSSALWRGYIAAKGGEWAEARQQFTVGAQALGRFSPTWRARFARANVEAALAVGDTNAAGTLMLIARQPRADVVEELKTLLVQAQLFQAQGDTSRALGMYGALAKAKTEEVSTPALLYATQLKLAKGMITPPVAAGIYDGLRYRWRGDATELKTIRSLGQLYISLGRYREALDVLRSAGKRLPDLPEAQQLQADLGNAFRGLFLDGQADGLEPIQALALFYDFKELTPVGSDGDLMVRRLARRLVDVDLLDQAAELLKYQAEQRLDGVPRAMVATDLALIRMMNRQPELALQAINSSRTTILPAGLNAERRVIEAKALTELGRMDHALEILENDKSVDANDVRGDIAWRQRTWTQVGPVFEKSLGDRWKTPDKRLSDDDENKLLRAAVGYSLAGDDAGLTRLNQRYKPFVNGARQADALRIALVGIDPDATATASEFPQRVSDNEVFSGWVDKMKQRFRDRSPPLTSNRPLARPAKPAA
jgi:tetratricopeptide (TPR) repeat protein